LGFNIRQYRDKKWGQGYKTNVTPSKEAQKEHLKAISEILDGHRNATQAALISRLNPVITGWARYFNNGASKETYNTMSNISMGKAQEMDQTPTPPQVPEVLQQQILPHCGRGQLDILNEGWTNPSITPRHAYQTAR